MAIATSQQINRYFNDYQNTEITFSAPIMKALAMDPRQIYIKCAGTQWPCIINSTSFAEAKIIIGTKGGAFQQIAQKDPPAVSIRYCFYQSNSQMLSFYISGKVENIKPYANSHELAIVSIKYTQRPPDDFIVTVGTLLDANNNALNRKDERIIITEDTSRKIGLVSEKTIISIQNVPRHCILRDISFGGAKVVLVGIANFLVNKDIVLQLDFDDPRETFHIRGKICKIEAIKDRKDIVAACLAFDESSIPIHYKLHLNTILSSMKKEKLATIGQPGK